MTTDAALAVSGGVMVVIVGGGAWFSTRSAVRGPLWALERVGLLRSFGWFIAAGGLMLSVVTTPRWMGLSVLYLGVIVVVLAGLVGRSLKRVAAFGGLDGLPIASRDALIGRARTGLMIGAGGFGVLAVLAEGVVALTMAGIGVALFANWLGLRLASAPSP
jgi:uncharacterized membrane protein YhdT